MWGGSEGGKAGMCPPLSPLPCRSSPLASIIQRAAAPVTAAASPVPSRSRFLEEAPPLPAPSPAAVLPVPPPARKKGEKKRGARDRAVTMGTGLAPRGHSHGVTSISATPRGGQRSSLPRGCIGKKPVPSHHCPPPPGPPTPLTWRMRHRLLARGLWGLFGGGFQRCWKRQRKRGKTRCRGTSPPGISPPPPSPKAGLLWGSGVTWAQGGGVVEHARPPCCRPSLHAAPGLCGIKGAGVSQRDPGTTRCAPTRCALPWARISLRHPHPGRVEGSQSCPKPIVAGSWGHQNPTGLKLEDGTVLGQARWTWTGESSRGHAPEGAELGLTGPQESAAARRWSGGAG